MDAADLRLAEHGAQYFPGLAVPEMQSLYALADRVPSDKAGTRIAGDAHVAHLLRTNGVFGRAASAFDREGMKPVRAILFDKNDATNWSLGWHQDRTVAVRERHDVPGFGPWTVKQGIPHVQPPFDLTRRMVTLRIHLDDVSQGNGPLKVALGTHDRGLVPVDQIDSVVAESELFTCLAGIGDVWTYSTPIIHASDLATLNRRRRVLQVDYSADALPPSLEWLGV